LVNAAVSKAVLRLVIIYLHKKLQIKLVYMDRQKIA